MIDVTNLNPLFLTIPVFLFIALGIFLGAKDGILRKLFDFVFLALLFFLMFYIVPPFAKQLETTQVIQNFVNSNFSGDFATLVSGLLTGPTYSLIAGAIVLLAYGIVRFILNFFIKLIFKKKGVINRVLGGIWQGLVHTVIAAIALIIFASPSIFNGGVDVINNAVGVKEFYSGVTMVQAKLKEANLPYDIESTAARILAGKDATKEDLERYESTLSRVGELLTSAKDGNLVDNYVDVNGNIKQEEAAQLVDDIIVLSEIMSKLPEEARDVYVKPIENIINETTSEFIDAEGNATQQIEVTEEQKATLNEVLTNLGVDPTCQENINKCVKVTASAA